LEEDPEKNLEKKKKKNDNDETKKSELKDPCKINI